MTVFATLLLRVDAFGSRFERRWGLVQPGMTGDEVQDLLGPPDRHDVGAFAIDGKADWPTWTYVRSSSSAGGRPREFVIDFNALGVVQGKRSPDPGKKKKSRETGLQKAG